MHFCYYYSHSYIAISIWSPAYMYRDSYLPYNTKTFMDIWAKLIDHKIITPIVVTIGS